MHTDAIAHIQALGDLGLATVLCLVAEEHGIILAHADELDHVASSISDICHRDLNFSTVILDCTASATDLEHFRESTLVEAADYNSDSTPAGSHHNGHHLTSADLILDERRVADVVIAKHLDCAVESVQIQALELMNARRIYTRASMHLVGKRFLFLALNDIDSQHKMNPHLNDRFAIAHYHASAGESDTASMSSASIKSVIGPNRAFQPVVQSLGSSALSELNKAVFRVTMTAEVSAYLQNIVVAMRLHRYVAGGITAQATRHLRIVARALAVLHELDYVTPALIMLAVRKVYLHRIVLADDCTERSLRWGGDPVAVRYQMQGIDVETAIETVIESVPSPL